MGIPELWKLFEQNDSSVCEVQALAKLSAEYFHKHGRPMRIAVDEAGWRFKNLTEQQVAFIRTKEPRANPIEKAIMWRLLRLMKYNIELIFIFDGPGRPWKRGGTAGRVDYDKTRLLIQLLDRLRIPHHRAPAEAEAECARMQQLGIVDAVWSDDADALMFGCTMLVRDHRPKDPKKTEAKKDIRLVDVFDASKIEQQFGLTQRGILLFVILVGGDYNTKGLEHCGPVAALEAIRHDSGSLADALWDTPAPIKQRDLDRWALGLSDCFRATRRMISVPAGFPRDLHFKNYRYPKVSSDEQLHDLNGLRRGWSREIDEVKLRYFFRERFNIWTKGWLKHVMPPLLVRKLMEVAATNSRGGGSAPRSMENLEDNTHTIKILPRRGKAAAEEALESKITFLPHQVSAVDLLTEPRDSQGHRLEDWQELKGEKGACFDPNQPIECEIADYILVHGLGKAAFDGLKVEASKPQIKKRKQAADEGEADPEGIASSAKRAKKSKEQDGQPNPSRKPRKKKQFNEVPGDTPPPEDRAAMASELARPRAKKAATARKPRKRKEFNEVPGDTPPPEERPSSSMELSGPGKTNPARPRKKKKPFHEVPGDTPPPEDPLETQSKGSFGNARPYAVPRPRPVFRMPGGVGSWSSMSPSSQPYPGSFESLQRRSPPNVSSFTWPPPSQPSAAHRIDTATRPTTQTMPALPDLIVLDDDEYDDFSARLPSTHNTPGGRPDRHDEDPDLAEAIRISLLKDSSASRSNIAAARRQEPRPPQPFVPMSSSMPVPRDHGVPIDREAIARARVAHLEKLNSATTPALTDGARQAPRTKAVSPIIWACIDLTDD